MTVGGLFWCLVVVALAVPASGQCTSFNSSDSNPNPRPLFPKDATDIDCTPAFDCFVDFCDCVNGNLSATCNPFHASTAAISWCAARRVTCLLTAALGAWNSTNAACANWSAAVGDAYASYYYANESARSNATLERACLSDMCYVLSSGAPEQVDGISVDYVCSFVNFSFPVPRNATAGTSTTTTTLPPSTSTVAASTTVGPSTTMTSSPPLNSTLLPTVASTAAPTTTHMSTSSPTSTVAVPSSTTTSVPSTTRAPSAVQTAIQFSLSGNSWAVALVSNRTRVQKAVMNFTSSVLRLAEERISILSLTSGSLVVKFAVAGITGVTSTASLAAQLSSAPLSSLSGLQSVYFDMTGDAAPLALGNVDVVVTSGSAVAEYGATTTCSQGCMGGVIAGAVLATAVVVTAVLLIRYRLTVSRRAAVTLAVQENAVCPTTYAADGVPLPEPSLGSSEKIPYGAVGHRTGMVSPLKVFHSRQTRASDTDESISD